MDHADNARSATDPPSRSRCLALMEAHAMLPNIKDHSLMVCEVSLAIAKPVWDAGEAIDLDLVRAGALLHDITKTQSIGTKENHAKTGEQLLLSLGYPKTAQVVREHIIPEDRVDLLTPCEIVAYADKRVLHDRVVGLDERFEYLKERYGRFPDALAYYARMRRAMNRIEQMFDRITGQPLDAAMAHLYSKT